MEATEFLGRNVSYMNYILIILKILKDSTSKSQSENPEEEEAFIAMVLILDKAVYNINNTLKNPSGK